MSTTREYVEGKVTAIHDADSGEFEETATGNKYPFFQRGAQVDLEINKAAISLKVTLPTGDVIIREVKKM